MAHETESPPGGAPSGRVTSPERPSPKSGVPLTVLEAGAVIGGFRLLAPIGAGGMARVWLADDEHLGRKVALKLLPPEEADDEGRARFLREARALARVDHPHVVHVFVSGIDGQIAWMALEYIEGDPLCDLVAGGALDEETALSLAAQVARGLAAVHKVGIVHRDIKPDNLLVDDGGMLRIVDFGVALFDEPGLGGFTTRSGIAVGTPHYMAPEQARGGRVDARADAWGLGATLYALLAGRPPYFANHEEPDLEILARVLREPAPDVRRLAPTVSAQTAAYLAVLLASDPEDRPMDLEVVADALEGLADTAMRRAEGGEAPSPWIPPPVVAAPAAPQSDPSEGWEASTDPSFRRGATTAPASASWMAAAVVVGGLLLVGGAAALVLTRGLWAPAPAPTMARQTDAAPAVERATRAELKVPLAPPVALAPAAAEELAVKPLGPPSLEEQARALAERASAAGMDAPAALAALIELGPEATPFLVELAKAPGSPGRAAVTRLGEARAARHVAALQAALFEADRRRAFEAVGALLELRNMEALTLLQRAADQHDDERVREAARKAARSMFSVEGD
jgi:eukaryotic-like serine/threonine-protein kinase